MARIRSVHPSLFTDEAWVSCSPLARVLYVGLMTDADDQGLFEWKPLQIKMRLLPADNADIPALLAELVEANLIASLESGGKKLGAIRKFGKFQRPKKPTAQFDLPPEWRTYVSSKGDGSEPDDDVDGASTELAPAHPPPVPPKAEPGEQMEDGGWRMEDESSDPGGSSSVEAVRKADLDALWAMASARSRERSSRKDLERAVRAAVKRGHSVQAITDGVSGYFASREATKEGGEYAKGIHRIVENDRWQEWARPPLLADGPDDGLRNPSEVRQRAWMAEWRESPNSWRPERGPAPGEIGCRIAAEIQREYGVEPAQPQPIRGAA